MFNNKPHKYKLSEPFNYQNDYEYGLNDQFSFWNDVARKYVHWDKEYNDIYDGNNEWFKGGLLNTCYNALDKHIINGRGNEIAFVHEIPLKQITYQITYKELYDKVCRLSRSLKNMGIKKGDVVLIYMHNCFELIISMLACSRIGAIHNVIFGGFYSESLTEMLNIYSSKMELIKLIIASNIGYIYNNTFNFYQSIYQSLLLSNIKVENIVLFNRKDINNNQNIQNYNSNQNINIIDWDELVSNKIEPLIEYELLESNHPLYILHSSGTTNKPKLIVRENGGHLVSINYSLRNVYKFNQGDTYLSTASFGWVSGHSSLIYGCLFIGVKSIFIEGTFNDQVLDYWSLLEKNKVNIISTTPNQMNLFQRLDPNGNVKRKFNLSTLKHSTIGSEKVYEKTINYLKNILDIPSTIDYWSTETGFPMIFTSEQKQLLNDSIGNIVPGYNIKVVTKLNNCSVVENHANQQGEIVIKLPLPPGCCTSLFDDDKEQELFKQYYLNEYKGYFRTKDIGYYNENGLWYYCSRSDDSISFKGCNTNLGLIENQVLKHHCVSECCVIGINDETLGSIPTCLLTLQNQNQNQINVQVLKEEINEIIKSNIHCDIELYNLIILNRLPKTKTGKRIKSILTSIFNNQNYRVPPTIQDIGVINELLEQYKIFKNNNQ